MEERPKQPKYIVKQKVDQLHPQLIRHRTQVLIVFPLTTEPVIQPEKVEMVVYTFSLILRQRFVVKLMLIIDPRLQIASLVNVTHFVVIVCLYSIEVTNNVRKERDTSDHQYTPDDFLVIRYREVVSIAYC